MRRLAKYSAPVTRTQSSGLLLISIAVRARVRSPASHRRPHRPRSAPQSHAPTRLRASAPPRRRASARPHPRAASHNSACSRIAFHNRRPDPTQRNRRRSRGRLVAHRRRGLVHGGLQLSRGHFWRARCARPRCGRYVREAARVGHERPAPFSARRSVRGGWDSAAWRRAPSASLRCSATSHRP